MQKISDTEAVLSSWIIAILIGLFASLSLGVGYNIYLCQDIYGGILWTGLVAGFFFFIPPKTLLILFLLATGAAILVQANFEQLMSRQKFRIGLIAALLGLGFAGNLLARLEAITSESCKISGWM